MAIQSIFLSTHKLKQNYLSVTFRKLHVHVVHCTDTIKILNRPIVAKPSRDLLSIKLWAIT